MRRFYLVLLLAVSSFAQPHFKLEQVLSAPFASSPVASPVGSRVVWLLNDKGARNLWAASGPDWKARKLTSFNEDDGQDIADLAWTNDGKNVLFARGGDFENEGENPNPGMLALRPDQAIWTVPADGGLPKKLTEGRAPLANPRTDLVAFRRAGQIFTMTSSGTEVMAAVRDRGTASDLRWSPDGKHLAFKSDRHDHSFIGVYSPAPKQLQYVDSSTDSDSDPVWSGDSAQLAYVRSPSEPERLRGPRREGEPWSIRLYNFQTGKARQIFLAERGPGSVFHSIVAETQLFWSGNQLVFPWERDGWCHLYSMPVAGGQPALLTPGAGEVEHVGASADGTRIFYSSNFGDIDRRHLWSIDPGRAGQPRPVTKGSSIEWAPTPLPDSSALIYLSSGVAERAHAVVQTAGGKAMPLAPETVPPEYPAAALVTPQPVTVTAADGLELHAQLFLPKDAPGRHPALIFFHGGSRRQMLLGSHYMYYYSNAYAMNQFLADQGYVVLSVNYRSGIGYGLNFREALNYGVSGGSEFNDVIGAGLYLKMRPDVDPKRIGVWGGSYGGYLTAMALARASDLFAVGVDFHGVHDWSAFLTNRVETGDPARRQAIQESLRVAFESSPMASVDTWRSPVLLIHGDDDRNVAFSQSVMLANALRQHHVSFEERIFPNEIHDFLLHRSWLEAYQATREYLGRYLGSNGQ